jgi:uncharacterized protein (DUF488 family)
MERNSLNRTDRPSQPEKGHGRTIYTLGTSTRTLHEFLGILKFHAIRRVIDVRRLPTSRFDHFTKEHLKLGVIAEGIHYADLGGSLGGYRKGGYQAYMDSQDFTAGIESLILMASKERATLICAERLPWRCHRRFIGGFLEKGGWDVVHLIEKDRTWKMKPGRGVGHHPGGSQPVRGV